MTIKSSRYLEKPFITQDSINDYIKSTPSFTIFKDNYFITGVPLNQHINHYNSDAKYQISFKQRLINANFLFKSFLFLTYTQKSFWDIYRNSSPFAETNYNPSLGLFRFFVLKNKLMALSVVAEHESNGKDSIYSKSWNRVSFKYIIELNPKTTMFLNIWLPFQYKGENRNLLNYVGFGEFALQWKSQNQRFVFDITARKGNRLDWKGSLQTQISYRMRREENQYFSIQWFSGYAESLINYYEETQMVRIGIMIKPSRFIFQ